MTQLKLFGKENNQIKCTHKLLGNNNEKIKEVDSIILINVFFCHWLLLLYFECAPTLTLLILFLNRNPKIMLNDLYS